jgi:hypothetical protein
MPRCTKTLGGFAVLCLLLLTAVSHAQVNEEWTVRYDGNDHLNDFAGPIVVDHAGNVIVTGESHGGFLTIKYAPDGQEIWGRTDPDGTAGSPRALAVDDEDNVYLAGYTYTGWVATGNQYIIAKYDSAGVHLWGRSYDGAGGPTDDYAYAVAVDDSGYVYVTGSSTRDGQLGIATLKLTPNGLRSSTWPNVGFGTGVRRYEVAGQAGYQAGVAIAVDGERNVYVAGASEPGTGAPTDYVTLKYDATGAEVWSRRYDGPAGQADSPVALALDDSANVYVAGTSAAPNQSGATRPDYATIKYDTDGNRQWVARFNGPADYEDRCTGLALDDAGNAHVTGYATCGNADFATVKYDAGGHQVWVAYYDSPAHGTDEATALTVDDAGCVYVTGKGSTTEGPWDYATIKYDALGNECWTISYGGPDVQGDRPTGIALDESSNVYVNGTSGTSTHWDDWLTVKYSQGTGAVEDGVPVAVRLSESRPNPFNPVTTIAFEITRAQHVRLKVYDLAGREVATLVDADLAVGSHRRVFRADGLASGTYLYRLQAGDFTGTGKLLLVR